jgi:hypothetical protein
MVSRDAQAARESIKSCTIWGSVATVVGIGFLSLGDGGPAELLIGGFAIAVGQFYVFVAIIAKGVALGSRVAAAHAAEEAEPGKTPW